MEWLFRAHGNAGICYNARQKKEEVLKEEVLEKRITEEMRG